MSRFKSMAEQLAEIYAAELWSARKERRGMDRRLHIRIIKLIELGMVKEDEMKVV